MNISYIQAFAKWVYEILIKPNHCQINLSVFGVIPEFLNLESVATFPHWCPEVMRLTKIGLPEPMSGATGATVSATAARLKHANNVCVISLTAKRERQKFSTAGSQRRCHVS